MQAQTITVDSNHSGVEEFAGFSVAEDSSAVAYVRFRKAAVGGQILAHLHLGADQSGTIVFGRILTAEGGVYVEEVTGSVAGVLYSGT